MSVKHAILGLLTEGPRHGYELRAAYEQDLVPRSKLNVGQVYTTLERLHRDGLVTPTVITQADKPDKKVYELTPKGREELASWLSRPAAIDLDLRNETFLKLMLARRLRGQEPRRIVELERRHAFARLHEVTQARARAVADGIDLSTTLLLDLAQLKFEGFLQWLDRCEEAFRKEESP